MTQGHRRSAGFLSDATFRIVPQTAEYGKKGTPIVHTFAALTLHDGGFTLWLARIPDNDRKNAPLLVNVPYFTAKVKHG